MSKRMSMKEAITRFVNDGDSVAIEGFSHLTCFAAGHEIIRQKRRDLELCRLSPDLIYDQMIAAGCARKLVFSWAGNPGIGFLHAVRRAVERGVPRPLEIEEYSHAGMVARFMAGAAHLPFYPLASYAGSSLPQVNPRIRSITSPYDAQETIYVVPPLNPDVAILHAQRSDEDGNTQIWGLSGVTKEVAFASKRVIVVVEEIVSSEVIRSDPNRTHIPDMLVDAVVHEPYGAHPSYVQGYYDRDNDFYLSYDAISQDPARMNAWLEEWVFGVADRAEYLRKLDAGVMDRLKLRPALAAPVNYGETL